MFDSTKNFTVRTAISNHKEAVYPVLKTYKQDNFIVNVGLNAHSIRISYNSIDKYYVADGIEIPTIYSDGCFEVSPDVESDWLFQLCTKHPFGIEDLEFLINDIKE